MKIVAFHLSYARALRRLAAALIVLVRAGAEVAGDQIRGRNSTSRRAVHLRRMFERMGGTFVPLGHHLAMPLQLRQSPYGDQLSRITDSTAAFPAEQMVAIVERTTGKPLQETFAQFDPVPVVSTATACVYQAVLRSGEKVVAKVRRPGIGELFVADLKVFDWLAAVLELFTISKPGQMRKVRRELRETLLEELDFVREARHQDTFRRAAKKSGKDFFTSPRVNFDLSGDELIVQEFSSGMWLWELLAAIEQDDKGVLALAAKLDIDRSKVARRLLWVCFWSWHENLFFLAEPHPHNIILGEHGTLTFIDFQSTGAMDRTKRRALQQNLYYARKRDPLNMARATLALLEPLPPLDVLALTKDLEAYNWHLLYAFETKGVRRPWYERTTAQQWLGLSQVARRYGIVIEGRILRLLRAALMHETLAVRLDESISVVKEYDRFVRRRAARATRRAIDNLISRRTSAGGKSRYSRMEQLAGTAETLFFRLRHALTLPRVNFHVMMNKGSSTFLTVIKLAAQVLGLAVVAAYLVVAFREIETDEVVTYRVAIGWVLSSTLFRVAVAVLIFVNARALLFRLEDKDN